MSGPSLTVMSVGIGLGAMLVGRLSEQRVEYGLIPLAPSASFVTLALLGALTPALRGTFALMVAAWTSERVHLRSAQRLDPMEAPPGSAGVGHLVLQHLCVHRHSTGLARRRALANAGLSTTGIFLATAIVTLAGTAWAMWLLPEALLRLLLVILTNTLYRLRIVGQDHVPQSGGALLVPNHVSFIDGFLLIASRRSAHPIRGGCADMPTIRSSNR